MDGAVIVKVVIMALILVLVIVTICTCNKFMVLKTRAENQASQIDIQLARRADLIPNLVEIVKGYAKHEKETLMTVVELRNRMTLADCSGRTIPGIKGEHKLSTAADRTFRDRRPRE